MNPSNREQCLPLLLVLLFQTVVSGAEQTEKLANVTRHMQLAHDLLEQPVAGADRASAAQQQALTGLDAVIAELTEKKSKCQGGECKPSGAKLEKPGKPGGKKAGKKSATSAPQSSGGTAHQQLATAATQLVKDLWGHLPERQQEQILQPLGEEFLPQYAVEIEAYFRALAQPETGRREAP